MPGKGNFPPVAGAAPPFVKVAAESGKPDAKRDKSPRGKGGKRGAGRCKSCGRGGSRGKC